MSLFNQIETTLFLQQSDQIETTQFLQQSDQIETTQFLQQSDQIETTQFLQHFQNSTQKFMFIAPLLFNDQKHAMGLQNTFRTFKCSVMFS